MKVNFTLIILLNFFLVSCASQYTGRVPKFDDSRVNKEEEYNRFKFKEGYWNQYRGAFTMGDDEKLYTMKSLKPVLDKVDSSDFKEEMKMADRLSIAGLSLIGAALTLLALDSDVENWSSNKKTAYYSLLGLSVVGSYISFHFVNNASKSYNKDLRERLRIGIKTSFNY